MRQPKFKFGDKVISTVFRDRVFTVKVIYYLDITQEYNYAADRQSYSYAEDSLEIYIEPPKPKKVYQFLFKLEGQNPIVGYDLWNSEQEFREHLFLTSNSSVEYIRIANTFEVPE